MSTPETIDATLEVLRKHRVRIFKSESFSVEFDDAAFEAAAEPAIPSPPGQAEGVSAAEREAIERTMFRSAT